MGLISSAEEKAMDLNLKIFKSTYSSPQRRQWHPTPVLLPGKSHRWRSLVGCSPWGREESDMTEWLHFHFSLLCIGEGNGNPFQCSCLQNPRDGVTQSQTRLLWLSGSTALLFHNSSAYLLPFLFYFYYLLKYKFWHVDFSNGQMTWQIHFIYL